MWEHNFENKKLIWRAVQTAEKTEKKRRSNVKQVYIDSLKRLLANQNGFFLLPLLQRIFNQFQSLDLHQRIISTKNECRKYCFSVFFSICPIWWRFAYCGTLVFFFHCPNSRIHLTQIQIDAMKINLASMLHIDTCAHFHRMQLHIYLAQTVRNRFK